MVAAAALAVAVPVVRADVDREGDADEDHHGNDAATVGHPDRAAGNGPRLRGDADPAGGRGYTDGHRGDHGLAVVEVEDGVAKL